MKHMLDVFLPSLLKAHDFFLRLTLRVQKGAISSAPSLGYSRNNHCKRGKVFLKCSANKLRFTFPKCPSRTSEGLCGSVFLFVLLIRSSRRHARPAGDRCLANTLQGEGCRAWLLLTSEGLSVHATGHSSCL